MPGMSAVEKIIARASGVASVRAGDVVYPVPDMVMMHDNVLPGVKRALDGLGIDRLAEPEKVIMVTDHEVLYGSVLQVNVWTVNNPVSMEDSIDKGATAIITDEPGVLAEVIAARRG